MIPIPGDDTANVGDQRAVRLELRRAAAFYLGFHAGQAPRLGGIQGAEARRGAQIVALAKQGDALIVALQVHLNRGDIAPGADEQVAVEGAGGEFLQRLLAIHRRVEQRGQRFARGQLTQAQGRTLQQRHVQNRHHGRHARQRAQVLGEARQRPQRLVRQQRRPGLPGDHDKLLRAVAPAHFPEVFKGRVALQEQGIGGGIQANFGELRHSRRQQQRQRQQHRRRSSQDKLLVE